LIEPDSNGNRTLHIPRYTTWCQIAGYFDGDGTVEFSIKGRRVHIRLAFDDNWKPFLEGIRSFLIEKGVVPGKVRQKEKSMTWHIVVSRIASVILMANEMLPFVVKKRRELQAAIEYLEGRMSGREFVEIMNEEVRQGQRTGKLRPYGPPYRRLKRRNAWHYVPD
jgi:hypothetical protein